MSATARPKLGNPFPGLRPFRNDEGHLFFGRESQVDMMVDKLAQMRFLAVVGTSGSGKSSLVNCGLRPALHRGLLAAAGTSWRMAQFRPGGDPFKAMARALAGKGALFSGFESGGLSIEDMVEASLRMSRLGLLDVYEQAQIGENVNLLVVVDQFEELFRYRQLGANLASGGDRSPDAKAFVNLLLEASAQTNFPIYVVLTMRSDFLGDCGEFTGLPEAMNQGQYLVPRLSREERRQAISGPVKVGGGEISQVLLTRLVNDVGDNPDQLSILQHALNRTWAYWQHEGRGEGELELAHYEAIGTMARALDQHAEKAFSELGTERSKEICERIFKALTDLGTDTRGTRRPLQMSTLSALAGASTSEVMQVMEVFRRPSRSFLMPPLPEALEAGTVIDISHESLMRVWERLKTWAVEEAQSAQLYRRLSETAILHAARKAALWRDPDLQLALQWRDREAPTEAWAGLYGGHAERALGFLALSEAQRQAEVRDKEEREKREAEQAQALSLAREQARTNQKLRRLTAVIAGLLMVAVAFGMVAREQRKHAERATAEAKKQAGEAARQSTEAIRQSAEAKRKTKEADDASERANESLEWAMIQQHDAIEQRNKAQRQESIARARELASQADLLRNTGTGALETSTLLAIESMRKFPLLENDLALRRALSLLPLVGKVFETESEISLVAFSSDGRVITGNAGQLHSFDMAGGKALKSSSALDPPEDFGNFPVGGNLLAVYRDDRFRLVDVRTGEARLDTRLRGKISGVAISPNGSYAAAVHASDDGAPSISLFTVGNAKAISEISVRNLERFAISDDGRVIAAVVDKQVKLIDTDGKERWKFSHPHAVTALAFSSDRRYLATGSQDGIARVLDTVTGTEITRVLHEGDVTAVAFSPNGENVASASGKTARVFETLGGKEISRMNHADPVLRLAFSPDGRLVVTASGRAARVFGLAAEKEVSRLSHPGEPHTWALSPDGLYVATSYTGVDGAHLFDGVSGAELYELKHGGEVNDVAFSPDGHYLTTASADGATRIFAVKGGLEISTIKPLSSAAAVNVSTSTFSWDGNSLASAFSDHTVRIFDVHSDKANAKEIARLPYNSEAVTLAFSPDGKLLAAGDHKALTVFRLDGQAKPVLLPHRGRINVALFSVDGRHLVTACSDGFARVFETASWKTVAQVKHQGDVPVVAFSPDGHYVVTGSVDDTARIFEAATGQEFARLEHADGIKAIAFREGGRRIIALSAPIISSHWFRPEDLIREACTRINNRELTSDEWKQYMGSEAQRRTCPK